MSKSQANRVLAYVRRLATAQAARRLSDGELLQRFAACSDEGAFEALLRRHGGMVLGVARRVLRNAHDAEDVLQATFLVLARKATSISKQGSVACWLHGVARRLALKAKTAAARRQAVHARRGARQAQAAVSTMTWHEIEPILDEELARLDAQHRAPLVLCFLEGKTRDEAAQQLGWSVRTLQRRLEQARELLRRRLLGRGVTMAAALVTANLCAAAATAAATAAVRQTLVQSLSKAATAFAAGAAATSVVSTKVAALTHGASMFLTRLKTAARMVAVVCGLFSAGMLIRQLSIAQAQTPEKEAIPSGARPLVSAQPQAIPGEGRLLFYRAGHLTLMNPDGKDEKRASKDRGEFLPSGARLSPDRKRIAFLVQVEKEAPVDRDPRRKLYVRGVDEPEPGTDLNVEAAHVVWSRDSRQLVAVEFVYGNDAKDLKCVNWLVDVKTKEKTALQLPENHLVQDWSRDGKHFLTAAFEMHKKLPTARLHLLNRDGSDARPLTDGTQPIFLGQLSPDARKVLYLGPDPERKGKERSESYGLFVLDIGQRKSMRVEQQPLNGEIMGFSWSPDGKRIAYGWRQVHDKQDPNQETESSLVVADADGNNPVTIATEKADQRGTITIGWVDWR